MSGEIQKEDLENNTVLQKQTEMEKEIDDFFDIYFKNEQFQKSCLEELEF